MPPKSSSMVHVPAKPPTPASMLLWLDWSGLPKKKSPLPSDLTVLRMKRRVHSSIAGSPVSSRACFKNGMRAVLLAVGSRQVVTLGVRLTLARGCG
ncbi:indoleamine 2 [Colletotrichum scovillei]|nr:indoleamine 2 [Colletotrichum scovillei]KAH8422155.1 indoleamine 2 [Colletotrichum scovillei]KAH8422182.1 indoleamine 2 [Colletotrichum scovillei]